jgi:hypothetical protein
MPSPTTDFRVDDELHERLQRAQDEIAGHLHTIRSQSSRIGKLKRTTDASRDHADWDRCLGLFRTWQRATGHTRSRFTSDRFKAALPFLSAYEDEMIIRAISGLAFDPYISRRKNGTEQRHDGWDLLFKSADKLEEFSNRAPLEWKETLEEHMKEVATRR